MDYRNMEGMCRKMVDHIKTIQDRDERNRAPEQ